MLSLMCTRRRIRPRPHSPSPWLRCSLGRPPRSEDDEDDLVLLRRTMKIEEAQVALLCRERIFAVAARCSSLTFDRCCFSLLSPCPFGILLLLVRPCCVPPSAVRWAPAVVRSLSRETFLLIQADNPQVRLHCGRRGEKRLRERCCPLSPLPPPHRRNLGGGGGGGSWLGLLSRSVLRKRKFGLSRETAQQKYLG